ncbi:MAG: glycosyltransferase family 2 protein [Treponema sp.]|jgi:GT2 family glycosyltransferase|nr:glycosyltransferase family 2 protein [Treponema sp.]
MNLSIVIPTYNRNEILRNTLERVIHFKEQYYELIVVDQSGKHDSETAAYLFEAEKRQDIMLIHSDFPNLPNARNLGIRAAVGDIVLFLDDDVTISDTLIITHKNDHMDKTIGCVTGKVIIENNSTVENIVFDKRIGLKDKIKRCIFCLFPYKASYVNQLGVFSDFTRDKQMFSDACIGCNMSFKKTIFDAVGLFDINYTGNAYREDTDMAVRLRKAGYRILYDPEAALIHHMSAGGGTRVSQSETYWLAFFKNQCYFHRKHFSSPKFFVQFLSFFDLIRCKRQGFKIITIFNKAYIEVKNWNNKNA